MRERKKERTKEVTCHSQQEVRNFPNELEDENGNVVAIGKSKRERESCCRRA
jgi:hypothetical protein